MESGFVICGGSPGCFPLSVGRLSGEAGAKDTDEERDGRREKNSCRQFRGSREPHLTARKRFENLQSIFVRHSGEVKDNQRHNSVRPLCITMSRSGRDGKPSIHQS
ncbi:hypothetical protein TNIN_131811 [Trichonephila inaurata madagascariensis]|uniref:Uncharacterized protein n=1 Tax=Trichonephila inaurata madagascariensis TaxID=2747483 RepID=A0A8X6YRD5_9ARAC|nr:hypothetical protein TNIN_131811 [Trichonephila inaurata madagascariensis]